MDRMKAILTLSAALMFVASPLFTGAFRGFAPEQFPIPQLDPPIVPAGYAFAIWGLIYAYLVLHAVFGLLKRDIDGTWDRGTLAADHQSHGGRELDFGRQDQPTLGHGFNLDNALDGAGCIIPSNGSPRPMAPAGTTGDLCWLVDGSKLCFHWPAWVGLWCIN